MGNFNEKRKSFLRTLSYTIQEERNARAERVEALRRASNSVGYCDEVKKESITSKIKRIFER